jgi:hypothetical protein
VPHFSLFAVTGYTRLTVGAARQARKSWQIPPPGTMGQVRTALSLSQVKRDDPGEQRVQLQRTGVLLNLVGGEGDAGRPHPRPQPPAPHGYLRALRRVLAADVRRGHPIATFGRAPVGFAPVLVSGPVILGV